MKVTVTKGDNVATFTWSDDLMDCDMVSIGFDDDELVEIMDCKGHEGANVPGYTVDIQ